MSSAMTASTNHHSNPVLFVESQIVGLWETLQATSNSLAACDRLIHEYRYRQSRNASTQTDGSLNVPALPRHFRTCQYNGSGTAFNYIELYSGNQDERHDREVSRRHSECCCIGRVGDGSKGKVTHEQKRSQKPEDDSKYCCGCDVKKEDRKEDNGSCPCSSPVHTPENEESNARHIEKVLDVSEVKCRAFATSPLFVDEAVQPGVSLSCPSLRLSERPIKGRRYSQLHTHSSPGLKLHRKKLNIVYKNRKTSYDNSSVEYENSKKDFLSKESQERHLDDEYKDDRSLHILSDTSISSLVLDSSQDSVQDDRPDRKNGRERRARRGEAQPRGAKRTDSRSVSRAEMRNQETFDPQNLLQELRAVVREEFQQRENARLVQEPSAANVVNSTLEGVCKDLDSHLRLPALLLLLVACAAAFPVEEPQAKRQDKRGLLGLGAPLALPALHAPIALPAPAFHAPLALPALPALPAFSAALHAPIALPAPALHAPIALPAPAIHAPYIATPAIKTIW